MGSPVAHYGTPDEAAVSKSSEVLRCNIKSPKVDRRVCMRSSQGEIDLRCSAGGADPSVHNMRRLNVMMWTC